MKKWFAACKYIKPSELEEALENYSRDGYHLTTLGEISFFYYDFIRSEPIKYRYVVDVSKVPKALYVEALLKQGWEYLGKTGNCHVWRMEYEEKRPENFANKECLAKHCFRVGIAAVLAAVLCFGGAAALVYGAYLERKIGFDRYYLSYIVEAVCLLPFGAYFVWAARKLLKK